MHLTLFYSHCSSWLQCPCLGSYLHEDRSQTSNHVSRWWDLGLEGKAEVLERVRYAVGAANIEWKHRLAQQRETPQIGSPLHIVQRTKGCRTRTCPLNQPEVYERCALHRLPAQGIAFHAGGCSLSTGGFEKGPLLLLPGRLLQLMSGILKTDSLPNLGTLLPRRACVQVGERCW